MNNISVQDYVGFRRLCPLWFDVIQAARTFAPNWFGSPSMLWC